MISGSSTGVLHFLRIIILPEVPDGDEDAEWDRRLVGCVVGFDVGKSGQPDNARSWNISNL